MTILITGAFGFVGTNLSAYLATKGHELWALDVVPSDKVQEAIGNKQDAIGKENDSRPDAKAQRGDGANVQRTTHNLQRSRFGRGAYVRCFGWEELERIPWSEVDAVVHLAGKAHDTRNVSDPQSYFDINVGLTKKVLEAAAGNGQSAMGNQQPAMGNRQSAMGNRQSAMGNQQPAMGNQQPAMGNRQSAMGNQQPAMGNQQPAMGTESFSRNDAKAQRKFIFFSSVKAVADQVEGVLTEEAVPDPQTAYGKSKLEAEGVVSRSFAPDCVRAHDFLYYILRPCMIHGPGNRGNLNLLYGVVRKGLPWPLGAFENRRSFASIGNVCAVVEGLLSGAAPSGIYQVADDEPLSTHALIGLIAQSLGRRPMIWRVPVAWVRLAARCGDALRLPLNSERLKKLTESYVASNAKIKAALGWEAMPVRAEDGMRKTLESFGGRQ